MSELIQLDAKGLFLRVLMVLLLLLAVVWSWFLVRWYLGNLMAEYLNVEEDDIQLVTRAVSLAPDDPITHWRLGEFTQKRLPPDRLPLAVSAYERAVSRSPNDYRLWVSYGIALEQVGEVERGEAALRRAVELAPSYAAPRWFLGNLLLRSGLSEQSFIELRQAGEADPELRPQVFNLAWEVYNKDIESLTNSVGSAAETRAEFASYLVTRGRIDDGIRLWNSLTGSEKRNHRSTGETIVKNLIEANQFHAAIEVSNDVVAAGGYRAAVGQILNGSFENDVAHGAGAVFGWQVRSIQPLQIGIDTGRGRNSARSLRLLFQVRTRLDSVHVSQLIPVVPDKQYDLEFYVRTDKLQSAGTPRTEIVDAVSGSVLGVSASVPNGTNEWKPFSVGFKAQSEAVQMRISREPCEDNSVCPIFGTVWYDDFNLKRRN